jgi:geranylgeranyl reductase family protein
MAFESHYDIVVVGGGPAGCSAAKAAAQEGAHTLLLDRKREIGQPCHCAELIPKLLTRHLPDIGLFMVQPVDTMVIHLPDKSVHTRNAPGYMIHRPLMDKYLALQAAEQGAQVVVASRVTAIDGNSLMVRHHGETSTIKFNILVGADGPRSLVRSHCGLEPQRCLMGVQREAVLTTPVTGYHIYFHEDITGGYGWLFPKDRSANVGLATPLPLEEGHRLLEEFILRLVADGLLIAGSALGLRVGRIPVAGPAHCTEFERILLVGDAAGHNDDITGAGNATAVICGAMAGKAAALAAATGNFDHLKTYSAQWQEQFGESLKRAHQRRREFESSTSFDYRRFWPAFPHYYRD